MIYRCRCIDKKGKIIKKKIETNSVSELKRILKENNLSLIEFSRLTILERKLKKIASRKLSMKELEAFCDKMYLILDARIDIIESFSIIKKQNKKHKKMKNILNNLEEDIKNGQSISNSLKSSKNLFPELLINTIKSGEESGDVATSFKEMRKYYKRNNTITTKIQNSFIQPLITLILGLVVVFAFALFILPEMLTAYDIPINKMPYITRVVYNSVIFFKENIVLIASGILLSIVGTGFIFKDEKAKTTIHKTILKIPILGKYIRIYETYKFVFALKLLSTTSDNIVSSLKTIKGMMKNYMAKKCIDTSIQMVLEGGGISKSLEKEDFFDEYMVDFVKIGEKTGKLNTVLENLYKHYNDEIDTMSEKYLSLLNSLIGLITGAIVLVLVLAMSLPTMSLMDFV